MISRLGKFGCLAGLSRQFDYSEPKPQVYAWGLNSFGQLGIGSELNQTIPFLIDELSSVSVKTICTSGLSNSSVAITIDGRVFTWGSGLDGALGHSATDDNVLIPTELQNLQGFSIVKVAVGGSHMAALTDQGKLLTWGLDDCGQCGRLDRPHEKNPKYYSPPVFKGGKAPGLVEGLDDLRIVDVACGRHFTVSVASDGFVYAWGSGADYVLGNGLKKNSKVPLKIDGLRGIVSVSCGRNFIFALDESGSLFSWGRNDFGQLGLSESCAFRKAPAVVRFQEPVIKVAAGDFHAVALTSTGKVYTWGAGADGQLGHGNKSNQIAPKQIQDLPQISHISAGGGHTALLTTDGRLLLFGRGREGQLGTLERQSSAKSQSSPQLVEAFKQGQVVFVSCGLDHTIVMVNP